MSDPIVEQITEWLVAALTEITTAGGYQQDLAVVRPEDLADTDAPIEDLTTIVGLEDPEDGGAMTNTHRFWIQPFGVITYIVGRGGTALSVDKRINRVRSDIEKRLGVELETYSGARSLCSNLADFIEIRPPEIWIDSENQATCLLCHVAIRYNVDPTDPYSQC